MLIRYAATQAAPVSFQYTDTVSVRGCSATRRHRARAPACSGRRAGGGRSLARGRSRAGRSIGAAPRDLLALQAGHQVDFFAGDSRMLRDRIARVRSHWNDAMPGHQAVLGMHAFGLEETGDHAQAESTGRRAIELEPRDTWAWQAVAHVHELRDAPDFVRHPLAERWAPHANAGNHTFNDLHAMMAFASAGRSELVMQLRETQRAVLAGEGDGRAFTAEDLLDLTLIESALRSGDRPLAAERAALRPASPLARRFVTRAGP